MVDNMLVGKVMVRWGGGGGGVPNSLCSFLLKPYLYQCGIDMVFGRFWLFLKELELRNTYLTHINVKAYLFWCFR